ncbi:MAG: hypothetical protein A3G51_03335 [Candidatus Yanofskybacteria bacterium RIFCSPLOWO2_12_FULL_43_11b]|uniref:Uncharacterized protein n=2 Tax=Parcubacteria group TaxID=1794811 RepID=A0A1G2RRC9_9BACT|nr:MAG: hypothetical protein A2742_02000 [Candidatus Yanofskybacteria bacterium RIFCSPHIGHO2_01_FULL_43_32]OGN34395.1 MAG: hypothetical protein A3G51_03335 [Candidatus Yanofskybacteria bacterium RIFCSPLOWO2_12_FULL_43_11b]OHA74822.1 MAG: hypothetical protein A3A32_03140 [Candidatus Wildermuthbacteria bacterium RIFCSPLOWO2_01_FULL_48_35]
MKPVKFLALLLGLLILPAPLYGQTDTENPATVIMQKVIQKMLVNEALKNKYLNFKKHFVDTRLDDSDKPKKTTTDQIIEVRPPNGNEVLIQEDGEPKNKKLDSGGEFEKIMEALSRRFDYEMTKPTADCPACPFMSKDGKVYLVINFHANGSKNTGGDDVKEIMNRSAGKMYVDLENLYVQRFESNMTSAYKKAWGIFQLKQADLVLEQGEVDTAEGKIIVTMSTTIKYRYSLFGETRGIRSWTYEDYRYVPTPPPPER